LNSPTQIAVVFLLAASLSLTAGSLSARTRIEDGADYLETCGGSDDWENEACRNPLLQEVFSLQANQSRQSNPFSACPISFATIEDAEKLSKKLHGEFVSWLNANTNLHKRRVNELAGTAVRQMDLCNL